MEPAPEPGGTTGSAESSSESTDDGATSTSGGETGHRAPVPDVGGGSTGSTGGSESSTGDACELVDVTVDDMTCNDVCGLGCQWMVVTTEVFDCSEPIPDGGAGCLCC